MASYGQESKQVASVLGDVASNRLGEKEYKKKIVTETEYQRNNKS